MIRVHEDANVRAMSVTPKTDMEGTQKFDKATKLPLWDVAAWHEMDNGDTEKIKVTLPSATQPQFTPYMTGFEGLEVGAYGMPNGKGGFNAGQYFAATGLIELEA